MLDREVTENTAGRTRRLPPIFVERADCIDFAASSRREWLETNGTGGFAMGTVSGANTRRYHGLLVASLNPPVDRYVLLAKVDEEVLSAHGQATALGTNQYPGAIHPEGYKKLYSFFLDPFPRWTYDVEGLHVEKSLFLVHGEQTVVVRYRARQPCTLRVAPMLAFRDFHALGRANGAFDASVRVSGGASSTVAIRPYAGLPALRIHHNGTSFEAAGSWYHATEYLEELERGLDHREDLYRMGTITFTLGPGQNAWLVATLSDGQTYDTSHVEGLEAAERARRQPESDDPLVARLGAAADQFLVERADGLSTAIAGYPWFSDWGRDTMIALPGLLLARARHAEARGVLRGFLRHVDRGVIPNRFADRAGEPLEYNTVDATLWMFLAVRSYVAQSGDEAFLAQEFYPAAREIIRWHRRGTHHGIVVDAADGLLVGGSPGTQLTWMDARVDGHVVTPRHGKAVEINALWYNALCSMADWARSLEPEAAAEYDGAAEQVAASFARTFWNPRRGFLFDVVTESGPDPRLRPNQIFAVGLPFALLTPGQRLSVVRAVEEHLLTHVGLRTLARGEPGYVGAYRGGPAERDGAYHQGTIWPWLLGPFVRAYLRVFGRAPERLAYCRALFRGLELHLREACLGQVSEVFDADAPFAPGGAPAQAWSVAELLQTLTVDLGETRP
jgi:predicted glycogen debranching enzyme